MMESPDKTGIVVAGKILHANGSRVQFCTDLHSVLQFCPGSLTGRGRVTAPIFLLVPQVKLRKRLDLARDADRAHEALPRLIVANWVEKRR